MPVIHKTSRIEIPLSEIIKKFKIGGKVTKFSVPTRHNASTWEEWREKIYLIIETEE